MTIPYAGQPNYAYRARAVKREFDRKRRSPAIAYEQFRAFGWDTVQIAAYHRVDEATALKWLTTERSKRLGLPDQYRE